MHKVFAYAKSNPQAQVPLHLRDSHYPGASKLDHGTGYLYPHSYPENWVEQSYLPESHQNIQFYEPTGKGADYNRGKPERK
jgi:putative ATPase